MKKYIVILGIVVSGFAASCTADTEGFEKKKGNDTELYEKDGDSLGEGDTGGQGGNNPIKP